MAGLVATEVGENEEDKEGQYDCSYLSDCRKQSSNWFDAAVGVYDVAKAAAIDIDVDPSYLVHMRRGDKPVNLSHVELMRRKKPLAFQRLVEAMAIEASMIVIPRAEIELQPGQAQLLRASRDLLGEMWPAYRDRLAAKVFCCTGDLIDAALASDEKIGK